MSPIPAAPRGAAPCLVVPRYARRRPDERPEAPIRRQAAAFLDTKLSVVTFMAGRKDPACPAPTDSSK
ncbi:hypothetical protein Lokhon_02966 [Limimaricola hongkongensis DSM 17492]|uniref:Uncharacterized protein n=1 Tax=Limimaricola hongkongensis DSM 17492 TaxID=1122180 RepID=A0A017HAY6_9RHOB|nr:hypothetical protein Lokhon_02966 [Limimaricola hongkongensis DSM 17492]